MLFINDAFAAASEAVTTQQGAGSPMGTIIMLIGFVAIFYFLLWRPQSQRAKQHRELISALKVEDEVVTNGGMLGKIVKVDDNFLTLRVAESVEIRLQKTAIASALPKGTLESI